MNAMNSKPWGLNEGGSSLLLWTLAQVSYISLSLWGFQPSVHYSSVLGLAFRITVRIGKTFRTEANWELSLISTVKSNLNFRENLRICNHMSKAQSRKLCCEICNQKDEEDYVICCEFMSVKWWYQLGTFVWLLLLLRELLLYRETQLSARHRKFLTYEQRLKKNRLEVMECPRRRRDSLVETAIFTHTKIVVFFCDQFTVNTIRNTTASSFKRVMIFFLFHKSHISY